MSFPETLHDAIVAALAAARDAGQLPDLTSVGFTIERPRDRAHGDWAANVAMVAARSAGMAPRAIADIVAAHLPVVEHLASVDVAGPGFLNFRLAPTWFHAVLGSAVTAGAGFGRAAPGSGERVQVEFVSSNPTGPLHIGHARGGVIGDVISRLLEFAGHTVEREYYYNDAGVQMDRFAASFEARFLQAVGREADVPDDGYHGHYVAEWAAEAAAELGAGLADADPAERRLRLASWSTTRAMRDIEETLEMARIPFDTWFSETSVHDRGEVVEAIETLTAHGHIYESDGATWFRTTTFGDEKDRVLVKSDGTYTYLAPDIAYHLDKFRRGFDRLINVWGADHHGYVPRMKAAVEALGYDPQRLELVITQTVNLTRGGEPLRMSTRAGEFVTFREVMEEVGSDATRYELASVSPDTAITFDLEAAKRQSMDNPVYYLQYAHARVHSLESVAAERGVHRMPIDTADLRLLIDPAEVELLTQIDRFSEEAREAAARRAPHRMTAYGQDLAGAFHKFYTDCRVITDDPDLTQARLWLVEGAKVALLGVLGLLGLSAPDRM